MFDAVIVVGWGVLIGVVEGAVGVKGENTRVELEGSVCVKLVVAWGIIADVERQQLLDHPMLLSHQGLELVDVFQQTLFSRHILGQLHL